MYWLLALRGNSGAFHFGDDVIRQGFAFAFAFASSLLCPEIPAAENTIISKLHVQKEAYDR